MSARIPSGEPHGPAVRLLFGVLSSANTDRAIDQICDAVGPHNDVLVHHDFSKNPDFALRSPGARLVPDPVRTNWGDWSLAAAVLKLMHEARKSFRFDYFQVLSDSCLPIKPISSFEQYLGRERPDAAMEAMPLTSEDRLAFLNYSYCYYPRNRIEKTLMRRTARAALAVDGPVSSRLARGGLALDREAPRGMWQALAARAHENLANRARRAFPAAGAAAHCGSTWFCVSRSMLERMLEIAEGSPKLVAHFQRNTQTSDEGFFPTLAMMAKPAKLLGFNHHVRWTQRRTGPDELGEPDFDDLRRSERFFARKFPKDPDCVIRRRVLSELAHAGMAKIERSGSA